MTPISTPTRLNLACGEVKKQGFINIDKNSGVQPNLLLDITIEKLPFEDGTIEEVWFSHGFEHIERHFWDFIMMEILRVLPINGKLVLAYPEFTVCVNNYLNDKGNKREYWLQTIFGRRMWSGDEHVTAVNSSELQTILESCGFYRVRHAPDPNCDYNSYMVCFKDPQPQCREQVMVEELGLGTFGSIQTVAETRK
jgi:predicted SAM-dependent methyltransferase